MEEGLQLLPNRKLYFNSPYYVVGQFSLLLHTRRPEPSVSLDPLYNDMLLLLLPIQTDTAQGCSRMYIHITFPVVFLLKHKITFIPYKYLYPNQIRRICFGSQNNSPSPTLLIEGIIVGLIIVIKLNIQYALPHR